MQIRSLADNPRIGSTRRHDVAMRSQPGEPTAGEMVEISRRVARGFDAVEQRPWTVEATMIELMKQVGDLAAHVMMRERYYLPDRKVGPKYSEDTAAIGNELADILYCLIRIADEYDIDLIAAHTAARQSELRYLENLQADLRDQDTGEDDGPTA